MRDYYPTPHLIENLAKRNITWGEVIEVADKPEVVYGPDLKGYMTHQKGDLCVILNRSHVVTVLLRNAEQWTDEQAQQRIMAENRRFYEEEMKKTPITSPQGRKLSRSRYKKIKKARKELMRDE